MRLPVRRRFQSPAEKNSHQVELARLQRLELRGVVAVDLDRDASKLFMPRARQVAAPVVGVAHVGDVLAEAHRADLVGPAADRDVHHDLVEGLGLAVFHAPLAAEDRQAAHGQRQLAVGLLEAEAHRALVEHVAGRDVFASRFCRPATRTWRSGVVAVLDVGGQHRVAIVEARLGPQAEGGRQQVRRRPPRPRPAGRSPTPTSSIAPASSALEQQSDR
jgi:hypothetical protein